MLSFSLAHKIYSGGDTKKSVSKPAITVATIGTAIGLAVMIISVCVVLGFKHSIRDKIIGFGSHATVTNASTSSNSDMRPICATDSMLQVLKKAPGVTHIQTFAMTQGLLKSDTDFLGVMFKGVGEDWDSTFISENMREGALPKFSSKASGNKIAISQTIADKLQLKVGEKIFAYFVDNDQVRTRRFTISAIYETNLSKYDEVICFTDIYTTQHLNAWEEDMVSGYELSISNFENLEATGKYLIKNVNRCTDHYGNTYTSATVVESNPQIFSWLRLLDLNIWIILALMICVAAVTMTSGLMIIILERVQMIGIMKAIGARNGVIRHTFLWFALFIIGRGLLIGNILGIGICLLQHFTGIVRLDASTYYVSEVPIELNIPLILLINVATAIVCTMVLVAPSFLVSHIKPAKSIRFE